MTRLLASAVALGAILGGLYGWVTFDGHPDA